MMVYFEYYNGGMLGPVLAFHWRSLNNSVKWKLFTVFGSCMLTDVCCVQLAFELNNVVKFGIKFSFFYFQCLALNPYYEHTCAAFTS